MKILAVVAFSGLIAGSAGSAMAFPITFAPGDYDNTYNTVNGTTPVNNQTTGMFRDVLWWRILNGEPKNGSPDFINQGNSLVPSGGSPGHAVPGTGPYTALNFTGPSSASGQSYLAIYDTTPGDGTATRNLFDASQPGGLQVSADVLFAPGNHAASGGVVALYNQGQDALALMASNGGGNNPDSPTLSLVFKSVGEGIELTSVPLNGLATFTGNTWYRVTMDLTVTGNTFTVNGTFQSHTDPTNPTSALGSVITTLTYTGSLSDPDLLAQTHNALVLTNPGEIGVMAMANQGVGACPPPFTDPCNDNLGVSITNFDVAPIPVPEPGTMLLAGSGLIMLGYAARRRFSHRGLGDTPLS